MISIKEKCEGKIYKALEFMYDGLMKQSKRKTFKIDMMSFGHTQENDNGKEICYGCAATSTIQQIANKNLTPKMRIETASLRACSLGFSFDELNDFEDAIDEFRKGNITPLIYFFYKNSSSERKILRTRMPCSIYMGPRNWKKQMPKLKEIIEHFKGLNV